jgi:hypothetical protein
MIAIPAAVVVALIAAGIFFYSRQSHKLTEKDTIVLADFANTTGVEPYQGGFLLHYLDKLVYPNISANVLTTAAVIVCLSNLAFYGRQMWISRRAYH